MTIGEKIKELRKKNNMTQEKLADYLCVSYQAVSKWETGASCPDISLVIPLTKILHVTADELLSVSEAEPDMRHEELTKAYIDTFKEIDLQKRYEVCETAVTEYPGDMKFLSDFAWATFKRASCFENHDEQVAEQENAIRLFASLIRNCDDGLLRGEAISGIVQALSLLKRYDEAKKYADLLPEGNIPTRYSVHEFCIEDEELIKFRQENILSLFYEMLQDMFMTEQEDVYEKIKSLIKIMIEDGNYLGMNKSLFKANKCLVNCLIEKNNKSEDDRVIALLGEMRVNAADYDECAYIKRGVYRYTAKLFDRLKINTNDCMGSVSTGLTKQYFDYISDAKFDRLRGREDFKTLTEIK